MKFRIYPENKSLYYLVRIFNEKEEMWKYTRDENLYFTDNEPDFLGICCPYSKQCFQKGCSCGGKMKPILGEILLCYEYIGGGYIAHEMTHGALNYLDRRGIKSVPTENSDESHEKLCEVVEEMVRQFWNKYYEKDS